MGTIGILHGGSPRTAQSEISEITAQLNKMCKTPPTIVAPDSSDSLLAQAKSLIQKKVDSMYVTGGSRAAHAALSARGNKKTPIIVFSSVAKFVLDESDRAITTGVCAHTSDHEEDRLYWLLKMLQYEHPTIGVLYNTNRVDTTGQWRAIADAAQDKCSLVAVDLNGSTSVKDAFELFKEKSVDGLLVAADPFFYRHLQEVVDRVNKANYPAIYQWSEFVAAGGLMSFGANRQDCYDRSKAMLVEVQNGTVPPLYEVPDDKFELVVSKSKAAHFGRWPLPAIIGNEKRLQVVA